MNSLGDNFLFGLFLGFCLGLAVFPLGCLIREILLAIKSLRPLPLKGWIRHTGISPAPRPNVRKAPGTRGGGVLLLRPHPGGPRP